MSQPGNSSVKTSNGPKNVLLALGLLAGLAALLSLVAWAPPIFNFFLSDPVVEDDPEFVSVERASQRQAMLLLLGGFFAAITAVLAWRRHLREQEALVIEKDRLWTSRYTEAVTQLGSDAEPITYGGVFALRRLALEANDEDAQMVVNVLCAYIRQNKKPPENGRLMGASRYRRPAAVEAAVESALHIASAWREKFLDEIRWGKGLPKGTTLVCQLEEAYLSGLNLSDGLRGASLVKATLENCSVTSLAGADLTDATLSHIDLEHCRMVNSILNGADLSTVTNLNPENLNEAAEWDTHTKWPAGYTPITPTKR